jgi:phage-related protein
MSRELKRLIWMGRSYEELVAFPEEAMRKAGFGLERVQRGKEPDDWKPMESVGPGACEIRVRTYDGGAVQHRLIYVARFEEAVYVLHAFEKKTQATPQHHLDVARARYKQLLRERREHIDLGKGR